MAKTPPKCISLLVPMNSLGFLLLDVGKRETWPFLCKIGTFYIKMQFPENCAKYSIETLAGPIWLKFGPSVYDNVLKEVVGSFF